MYIYCIVQKISKSPDAFKTQAGPIFLASDRLHCSAFDKLQRQGAHRGWQIGEREKKKPMCTSEFFFLASRCF